MKSRTSSLRLASERGFTLIELVMVIAIVGILAAVAMPRFFDMGSSARTAALNGIYGAVNSAMSIGHSAAVVSNQGSTATGSVTVEGQTVSLAYGYPTAAGIAAAVNTGNTTATISGSTATWSVIGGSGTCSVVYTAAAAITTPATAVTNTSGC